MRDSQPTYGASSLKPRSSQPRRDLNCFRRSGRRRRRPPAVPRISGLRSTGRHSDAFPCRVARSVATLLPKVLEIERRQLADYARVDYAIRKGEDEIAALEELWLGPNKLQRKTSVVRDRTVLAVREVRNNMAKRAITAKNVQGSLIESLRQRSRFAAVDTVDASLRARCFASLECIPTLTLLCHFIDAIKAGDFARAESRSE